MKTGKTFVRGEERDQRRRTKEDGRERERRANGARTPKRRGVPSPGHAPQVKSSTSNRLAVSLARSYASSRHGGLWIPFENTLAHPIWRY